MFPKYVLLSICAFIRVHFGRPGKFSQRSPFRCIHIFSSKIGYDQWMNFFKEKLEIVSFQKHVGFSAWQLVMVLVLVVVLLSPNQWKRWNGSKTLNSLSSSAPPKPCVNKRSSGSTFISPNSAKKSSDYWLLVLISIQTLLYQSTYGGCYIVPSIYSYSSQVVQCQQQWQNSGSSYLICWVV